MLKSLIKLAGAIFLFLFFFVNNAKAEISSVSAPTMIAPNEKIVTAKVKPVITGLTKNDTEVYIYIDNVFNGKARVTKDQSGTAHFDYYPYLNLSRGFHNVYAVAKDQAGMKSKISNILNFKIEMPMPAPTMFKPVVNKNNLSEQYIVGLAKNNSQIKIYINHRFVAEFMVKNNKSGTANFAFKVPAILTKGKYLVYTTAIDTRGKESSWSNIISLNKNNLRDPRIGEAASESNLETRK